MGSLVAVDATLRLFSSFLGASPIIALIVLVDDVFGARFGFVMGALTLLLSLVESLGRYKIFYLTTSFVHDRTRSHAIVALIAIAGGPVIRLLERFRTRTAWCAPASTVTALPG